jgi:putative hydrolase of the HAD superfamily
MKQKFKAVFFDLDHTLCDFETNSSQVIGELLEHHNMIGEKIPAADAFMLKYRAINKDLWDRYHINSITKEELRIWRFQHCFREFGIQDQELCEIFANRYLELCPDRTALFPGALELLGKLKPTHSLHIITNGFREVQYRKLRSSGLFPFFDKVHISEEVGWKKPEPEIFEHALKEARLPASDCVMVGDNLDTDISGAMNAGIQAILFDPERVFTATPPVWYADSLDAAGSLILGR